MKFDNLRPLPSSHDGLVSAAPVNLLIFFRSQQFIAQSHLFVKIIIKA